MIDAVYTWVDGADPAWRERFAAYLPEADRGYNKAERFRSSGEIILSVAATRKFAPWIDRIFVVTAGQTLPPELKAWDVVPVTHQQIFARQDDLPTFNSLAIEVNLHRIPGLSDSYLYLNDDVFFGRPVAAQELLGPSGMGVQYFARSPIDLDAPPPVNHWNHLLINTVKKLCRGGRPAGRIYNVPHTGQVYDRRLCEELELAHAQDLAQTSGCRFRGRHDYVYFRLMYAYSLLKARYGEWDVDRLAGAEAEVRFVDRSICRVIDPVDFPAPGAALAVLDSRPMYICIQDSAEFDTGMNLNAVCELLDAIAR